MKSFVLPILLLMLMVGMSQGEVVDGRPHSQQLQQRPPQQVGGLTLPPERPQLDHRPHRLHRIREDGDDAHARHLLAKAATGLAACWNATAPQPPTHLSFGPEGRCCTFKLGCVGNLWSMACPECEPKTSHVKIEWYPHSHHQDGIVQGDLEFRIRAERCQGRLEVAFTGDKKAVISLLSPIHCSQ